MNKRNYRAFIILKQDCKGYSISGKEPSGYCKIDAYGDKVRIQVYVQDLKTISKEKGYKVTLLANLPAGPKQLSIDTFYVDEKGKKNFRIEMNRNNIGGSGLLIEQFEGVAILAEDSFSNNVAPLLGFKKESFEWEIKKSKIKESEKVEEKIKEMINEEKEEREETKEIIKEKDKVANDMIIVEQQNKEDKRLKIEELDREKEALEVFEERVNEETISKNKTNVEKEESFTQEAEQLFFNSNDYWNFCGRKSKEEDYLSKILMESIRMNPFENPNEDMEWYRISFEELPLIIDFPWRWYSNPYLLVGAQKYNHLLLGKNKEQNTYYLGIPDIYSLYSKERAESFGCNTFLCCRNTKPVPGEYGYWIVDLIMNL